MATYYAGIGGNDGSAGTSWALRRLTPASGLSLCGASDTLIIGAGIHYSVSSLAPAANGITIRGDYDGALTDGTGGVTYLCGHTSATNATFAGFGIDNLGRTGLTVRELAFIGYDQAMRHQAGAATITIEDCAFVVTGGNAAAVTIQGAAQSALVIRRCLFWGKQTISTASAVTYTHTVAVDNATHVFERNVVMGLRQGCRSVRVGGISIKNNLIAACDAGVIVATAVTVGQTLSVLNNRIVGNTTGLSGTVTGEIVEDYNQVYGNATNRTNTAAGANSNTYPDLIDLRWFMETVKGGTVLTPLDLSTHSGLVNLNDGSSPSATDMRLAAESGAFQEWGPLEYLSSLDIEGGGGIVVSPLGQALIQAIVGAG